MNLNVKNLWLERLRSGQYKQGRYCLHRDDSYCCLGVLCEIAAENGVVESASTYDRKTRYGAECQVNYLPAEVQEWAGLSSSNPRVTSGASLAELNDGGKTFAEIADLIEADL